MQVQVSISELHLALVACHSMGNLDTLPFSTLVSTVASMTSSQQATATLWQLLLCTKKIFQHCPDPQEVQGTEGGPVEQLGHFKLILQFLQEQQPGYQHCSGVPKECSSKDALTAAFPGLLHASLCLLAVAHDIEHLSCANPNSRARQQPHSSNVLSGTLSERAQNQQQGSSTPNNTNEHQIREHAELAGQELQANVSLIVMQLQGFWNISSCTVHSQTSSRMLFPRPDKLTQPRLLWKAVASALLHFQTAFSMSTSTTRSIPRSTGSAAKLTRGTDPSKILAMPRVLDLGVSVIGMIAQSAAQEVHCWLHDAHAMLCSRPHANSSVVFCGLQQQLCLPPAGAFQVC